VSSRLASTLDNDWNIVIAAKLDGGRRTKGENLPLAKIGTGNIPHPSGRQLSTRTHYFCYAGS
jgi:hypothetical protein